MPVQYDNKGRIVKPFSNYNWTVDMVTEYAKCAKSVKYFATKHCKVPHPTRGIINLDLRDYQMRMLDTIDSNQKVVANVGRQIGKSTICSIYALWYAMFSVEPVNIFILSNKARSSQAVLDDIKVAYEELEPYLKRGIIEYNKTAIQFDNRSAIKTGPTTKDSIRGESVSLMLLDEFAHIAPHIAEEFYQSTLPTISTGGKIIIISTPNGNANQFYDIFSGAIRGDNGFAPFSIDWREVPRFDSNGKRIDPEEFKDKTIKASSLQSWMQEHECSFLGSAKTLVSGEYLENMKNKVSNSVPQFENDNWCYWEKPKQNHIYVIGVDVAKGTEADYSVMQILDITNRNVYKQVTVYASNTIDPFDFTDEVYMTAKSYNDAYVIVENNTYGHEVCRKLREDLLYENLFKEYKTKKIGVTASVKTKSLGTSLLKRYVENNNLIVLDKKTYKELCYFIEHQPDVYKCPKGPNYHDDRVMALIWACYFIGSDFWREWQEYIRQEVLGKNTSQVEEKDINFQPLIIGGKSYNLVNDDDFFDSELFE